MPKLPSPSPNPKSEDHIFVSYSSKDRAFVDRLADDLRKRGHTVWIDFQGIRGGEEWKQSIADALHPARVVLLLLSPDSVQSEWVEEEIRTARDLKKPIIPLLLRTIEGEIAHTNLAWVYKEVHYRDFRGGYSAPFDELLKDLPKPKSGIPGYCQKLAAKIAGKDWGLDHYIQEEARLLPINASPYEDGVVKGAGENLIRRLQRGGRMIVLGEPGMGKSVALERFAWELAISEPPALPVIIKLLEYQGEALLEWVRLLLIESGDIRLANVAEASEFLRELDVEAYLLLDGLNEVRPEHRDKLIAEITRFALEFPRIRLVVTSRVQDEAWKLLRQGSAIQETLLVQAIRAEQAQSYLTAHLGAVDGQRLWTQLDERMRGLATTPLLLWLIKEAWREARARQGERIRMPENRGELYRNFVTRLLRRDDERRLSASIPEKQRLTALERLALRLHEQKALTMPRETALEVVGNNAQILDALLVNGLLVGDDVLRFAPHQTMQEHFAARGVLDEVLQKVQAGGIARLARRFGVGRGVLDYAADAWWAETFIQMAGLTDDPNALARTIAEVNPWLAWWCAEEGKQIDDQTREAIGRRSMALVSSRDVNERRAAAQALAKMETLRTVEPLMRLAMDEDAAVIRTAISGLNTLGEPGQLFERVFQTVCTSKPPKQRAAWGRAIADIDPRPGVGLRADGLPDIDWVEIPGGEFIYQDNKSITLPTFEIARYPLTNAQFAPFIADGGYDDPQWWTPDGWAQKEKNGWTQPRYWGDPQFNLPNHPVVGVSWYEAVAYCQWLNAKYRALLGTAGDVGTPNGVSAAGRATARPHNAMPDTVNPDAAMPNTTPLSMSAAKWGGAGGGVIRLPTEQEWEKAARGTDGRVYPWGDDWDETRCNNDVTANPIGATSAVGIFPDGESPYHVMDLSGNVWEWCATKYESPEDNRFDGTDDRVLRGGSWSNNLTLRFRCGYRYRYFPLNRNNYLGFRVSRFK